MSSPSACQEGLCFTRLFNEIEPGMFLWDGA